MFPWRLTALTLTTLSIKAVRHLLASQPIPEGHRHGYETVAPPRLRKVRLLAIRSVMLGCSWDKQTCKSILLIRCKSPYGPDLARVARHTCVAPPTLLRNDGLPLQTGERHRQSWLFRKTTGFETTMKPAGPAASVPVLVGAGCRRPGRQVVGWAGGKRAAGRAHFAQTASADSVTEIRKSLATTWVSAFFTIAPLHGLP